MKREEAVRIGMSFYTQTAAWFLVTALLVFASRGKTLPADGNEAYAGLVALAIFSLATLLVLMLGKTKAFMRVYSWLVYFAMLYGAFFVLSLLWPLPAALAIVPVAACVLFFSPRVISQNAVLAIALAGIAAQFGALISFPVALAFLSVLALYDIVAVNITHHMVALAKSVIQKHLPVVFVMPNKLSEVGEHTAKFTPGSDAVFLGAGDIALPAVLIATAPTSSMAAAVVLGALAGFLVLTAVFLKGSGKHPLPALPFLIVGIFLALALNVFR